MTTKNKLYLGLSILVLLLTFVAILKNFETITFLGMKTELIWIPIWIAVVILPLLNVYEIAVTNEEYSKFYWLGLLLNIITILFILRDYKMELLP
ncbi:hypothetical protein ACFSX9_12830 [Flavobacterium ardleyense]|uniref:Uncharacterized protein n=1 Tax=Flavobacterium ardleyense TaxID=2038737 RepID=A0ABW5Z9R5_9FLAO